MKRSFGAVGRRSAARRRILAPWVILLLGCGSGHGGSPDGGGNRGGGSGRPRLLGERPYGLFSVGLSLPGDLDGDGYADLAVGAPWTGVYVGTAYLYPGTTSGVAASPSATLNSPDGVEGEFGSVIAGR